MSLKIFQVTHPNAHVRGSCVFDFNFLTYVFQGPTDYIKLSIIGGKKLQFQYQAGSGPLGVNVETSYHLNDNQWHAVSVERNRYIERIYWSFFYEVVLFHKSFVIYLVPNVLVIFILVYIGKKLDWLWMDH